MAQPTENRVPRGERLRAISFGGAFDPQVTGPGVASAPMRGAGLLRNSSISVTPEEQICRTLYWIGYTQ